MAQITATSADAKQFTSERLPYAATAAPTTPADVVRSLVERAYADPSITPGTFPRALMDAIVHATIDAAGPLYSAAKGSDDANKGRSDVAFSIAVGAMGAALRTSDDPAGTASTLAMVLDMITPETSRA